jgi:hypothetical protein
VFVQTDNPAGNTIVAYDRASDGTLSHAGNYPTGGLGGVDSGSVLDHLASEGSLVYEQRANLLYWATLLHDTGALRGPERQPEYQHDGLPAAGARMS